MTTTIDIRELPARLEELLALASAGREVVLNDGQTPRAQLLPIAPRPARVPGLHADAVTPSDDFDAPLPDEFWTGKP